MIEFKFIFTFVLLAKEVRGKEEPFDWMICLPVKKMIQKFSQLDRIQWLHRTKNLECSENRKQKNSTSDPFNSWQ